MKKNLGTLTISTSKLSGDKQLGSKFFPPTHFHWATPTEVYDRIEGYWSRTATPESMFKKSRISYQGGLTAGCEKTKTFLYTVGSTIWKSVEGKICVVMS